MIVVIDTSSARSAVAVLGGDVVLAEAVKPAGRDFDVAEEVAALLSPIGAALALEAVMVALGPGSFTGLRQGIAFGVGLAMSREVPLLGVGSLELTAARARQPALAVVEAGRGRVFYLSPDGQRGSAEITDLPGDWPVVGWLGNVIERQIPEPDLRSFGEAAILARGSARQLGYGTVKPDYMHEFGRLN
ncbi:MAG: tRNA (adenosine(37)-N6)-threonylcarbamoyltransferase complex dimerization subunit type 1 TsaB [Candidatus Dormibacteraeota bacterium]|nr:tRNA (adenosine(37)-N6)-threonylcarbamoyltransferase complex dimerization subunit type 1 TsaB [Candidatus Dormibacteraeota bacterium]